jgi:hypothetical protein
MSHKARFLFRIVIEIVCFAGAVTGKTCLHGSEGAFELMTNPALADGFGSQYQLIIWSAIYAELNNKKFLYTPFRGMAHNYDNDPDFLRKKEVLINLIDHFEINEDPSFTATMSVFQIFDFFNKNIAACCNSSSLKTIKSLFLVDKQKDVYFNKNFINIAVHVRRQNPCDHRLYGCHIPDAAFKEIIDELRLIYGTQDILFHIYSQGYIDDFESVYEGDDIVFHINGSIEDTFTAMVLADVLVTAPSSLSYTAAVLSEGTIYYIPFWHPPLPGWVVIGLDPDVDGDVEIEIEG